MVVKPDGLPMIVRSSLASYLRARWRGVFALTLVCGLLSAQAWAEQDAQTPEGLYGQAVKQLERGYFERSFELFEKLKTRYPFSQFAVLAELRLGDTYFQKGEYAEAIDAYRTFQKLHPRHPELDYVVYRIGLSELKQSPKIAQRDQASTRRMLAVLQNYETLYPQSKYLKDVVDMRKEGRERLAMSIFGVGEHYYRRGRFEVDKADRDKAFAAARERFEQVLDEYPDVEKVGADALYWIGFTYAKEGRKADAEKSLERLQQRFPKANHVGKLKGVLARTRWPAPPTSPAQEAEMPAAPPPPVSSETLPVEGAAPDSIPAASDDPATPPPEAPIPDPGGQMPSAPAPADDAPKSP